MQIFRNDDRKQKDLNKFFNDISERKEWKCYLQDFIKNNKIKNNKLHRGQIFAFYVYTGFAYKEINAFFRSDGKCVLTSDPSQQKLSIEDILLFGAVITLALSELPSNEETTTAIRFAEVSTSPYLIEAAQNESIIYESSFLSTHNFKSLFKVNAFPGNYEKSKQIIFIMDNFVAKSIMFCSQYPTEREILGPMGMRSICLAQDVDEEGRQFLVYKPISALSIKLRVDKIFDKRRLYAAMLLNKHYLYLIHFHDLYGGKHFLPGNIWAALCAIVKGHSYFRCAYLINGVIKWKNADPITELESLATEYKKGLKEALEAANDLSVSRELMNITSLLSLVDELPKLKELGHLSPQPPNDKKPCSGEHIPSYALFEFIYQKFYSAIPKWKTKDIYTMQQIRTSERYTKIKDYKETKIILKNLGIPLLSLTEFLNFMEEKAFFRPEVIQIIISYMFTPSKSSYINIYKDSSNQQYLDGPEISAFLIWKEQSKHARQNVGYEQKTTVKLDSRLGS